VEAESAKLGLTGCAVIPLQAREVGRIPGHAGSYDAVLLRAVGNPGPLVRECRQLLKPQPGAQIVFYMTPESLEAARAVAEREARKFRLGIVESPCIELPASAGTRQFLRFIRTGDAA